MCRLSYKILFITLKLTCEPNIALKIQITFEKYSVHDKISSKGNKKVKEKIYKKLVNKF